MPDEIRIYLEGGGDEKNTRAKMRKGFNSFLASLREKARNKRIRWQIVACGSRSSAFEDFHTALRIHPEAYNILLVDSEGVVKATPWAHLRQQDQWHTPDISENHCHLMVQAMEAWLIADSNALALYYGQGFRQKDIPRHSDVENIPKNKLEPSLIAATRHSQKGRYHKIRHVSELLERINPELVCAKAGYCKRLFEIIEEKIDSLK